MLAAIFEAVTGVPVVELRYVAGVHVYSTPDRVGGVPIVIR
jgi:hypothetical protein